MTVRHCVIATGRGGGRRNQHGIVAGSFAGPEEGAPSARFGIVYSTGHAYHSNRIRDGDGNSIDCHGANVEIAGNWTDGCRYGAKFPHSANALIHHNRFGGTPADGVVLRFYSANDWAVGVGYACDELFVFANLFEDNAGRDVRVDGVHGDVYLLGNDYRGEGTGLKISRANRGSTDPGSFRGTVHLGGEDARRPRDVGADIPAERVVVTDDARLLAHDAARMLELMNRPKDRRWTANARHPLPPMRPRGA